jgi:hypothetical protein
VDSDRVVRTGHHEPLACGQAVKGPVDEQVAALVKSEVGQLDADHGR